MVSWALIAGIMVIVAIAGTQGCNHLLHEPSPVRSSASIQVKKLPYPYRAILDAGVCAGLSWGMGATLGIITIMHQHDIKPLHQHCRRGATVFIYAKSVTTGKAPEIDP